MRVRFLLPSAAIVCLATPAFGHAFLQHANPGAGTTFPAARAPQRVVLSFSEKLEPAFSGATVTDGSGRDVAAAPVAVSGSAIVVLVRPRPGNYRVIWHAVSVDTHRTEGAYSFTVKP